MDHVAIMKKSWGLLPMILTGEKTIESRWYRNRSAPWGRIGAGDRVYFKDSGEPVTAVAAVSKVLAFEHLTPALVRGLLAKYGKEDGIPTEDQAGYARLLRDKRYCLLVFLRDARPVKPFDIDKRGFGAMSAWLTVRHVRELKR